MGVFKIKKSKVKFITFIISTLMLFPIMPQIAHAEVIGSTNVSAWGNNNYRQIMVTQGLKNVKAIAAGSYHTVALKEDGTVAAWGNNNSGQCNVPAGLSNVIAIAAGNDHSVALKDDGTVIAWGGNGVGQCKVPAGLANVKAIAAGGAFTVALKEDGTIVQWGMVPYGAIVPEELTNVIAIAACNRHAAALKEDGTVVAWGDFFDGQTTIPETVPAGLTNVKAIAAGVYHTVALKEDGTVAAWGLNGYGQTTVPAGLTNVKAIAAGWNHTVALKEDGTVVGWGSDEQGQITAPAGLTNVNAIAAGYFHTVAIQNQDQGAPTGLTEVAPTTYGGNDGKITGTTTLMEYKPSTETTYTAVTGTEITGLKAGTYNVRYTARPGYNVGADAVVVVNNGPNQDQPAPIGLAGVKPTTYWDSDGKITGATASMEYKPSTETSYTAIAGTEITGLASGTYNVRYAARAGYNPGADAEVVVENGPNADQTSPLGLTAVSPSTYGGADGKITGVTTLMEYKLSTATSYSAVLGTEITGLAAGTYYVRYAARLGYNAGPIATVTITNAKKDQTSPTGLVGTIPSAYGGWDGKITGTTIGMEYKRSAASAYTPVTGTQITGLTAGTYNVRYAAKIGYNHGSDAVITVDNGLYAGPAITKVQNGWSLENNIWYYYQNGSKVKNGWKLDSHGWCFLNAVDGSWVQEGWAKDSHGWGYLRSGYWVDYATWVKDSNGWCFIGSNGYYDSSVAYRATNPLEDAAKLVEKALEITSQSDIDAARNAVAATNADVSEQAPLLSRLTQ